MVRKKTRRRQKKKDGVEVAAELLANSSLEYSAKLDPGTIVMWGQLIMQLLDMFKQCRDSGDDESDEANIIRLAQERRPSVVFAARKAVRREGITRGRKNIVRVADGILTEIASSDAPTVRAVLVAAESR